MEMLDEVYWGNSVKLYLIGLAITTGFLLAVYLARAIVLVRFRRLAERTRTRLDDLVIYVVQKTRFWVVLVLGLYLGTLALQVPPQRGGLFEVVAVGFFAIQAGLWASAAITFLVDDYRKRKLEEGDTSSVTAVALLGVAARIAAWTLAMLLILDNVGVDVTALVAGLGIGGLALALAVKDILQDLLSSMSIMLDKPFEVGDFILIGDLGGTVEHIGLKSTRLRASSGEQLVFGNDDLLRARIRNMKRMNERRAELDLRMSYQTPVAAMRELPGVLEGIVNAQEHTRFDRSHFLSISDSAYVLKTVYYMTVPSGAVYNATQEQINLAILEALESRGLSLAYPTQTVHVQSKA